MRVSDFAHYNHARVFTRRAFLGLAGIAAGFFIRRLIAEVSGLASEPTRFLLSAPLNLGGVWKSSPADAALRVLSRMREVSLEGLRLLSDRQPDRLHVDNHPNGLPALWLHRDHTNVAWIIVDVGPRDWCKLAYQFGHELGHVLCNSWDAQSKPRVPCQWLEESMVEAFSIRGLGRLAASWERNPPFAGDAAFGAAIREYRENLIKKYTGAAEQMSNAEIASWFRASRSTLEGSALSEIEGPFIVRVVGELERDNACVEDLGGLNRWAARSGVPLEDYLTLWGKSCSEVHAAGQLPARLRSLLLVS
jgi:hypothetical protein